MTGSSRNSQHRREAAVVSATLLIVFHLVAIFAGPERLPYLIQRLVGLTGAALAALVVLFGVHEFAQQHRTFRFLWWRQVDSAAVAGCCVFVLVLAWWFSPLAPIVVDNA